MREVKPTQKPVPSSDIKDLFFNSGLLDIWATSLEHKYIDRFGNCHLTAAGMEWIFNELVSNFNVDAENAIKAAGYVTADSFQEGFNVTEKNQVLRWKEPDGDGEYYRWDGEYPKLVPLNSTPSSSGGVGKGAWLSVGDATLRGELPSIVGDITNYQSSSVHDMVQGRTVAKNKITIAVGQIWSSGGTKWRVVDESSPISIGNFRAFNCINVLDFGAKGDGVTDDTDAIQSAVNSLSGDSRGGVVYLPRGTYIISKSININRESGDGTYYPLVPAMNLDNISFIGEAKGGDYTHQDWGTTIKQVNSTENGLWFFKFTTGGKVKNIQVTGARCGVKFDNCLFFELSSCSLSRNEYGCEVWGNGVGNIQNNKIRENYKFGLALYASSGDTLVQGNDIGRQGYGKSGSYQSANVYISSGGIRLINNLIFTCRNTDNSHGIIIAGTNETDPDNGQQYRADTDPQYIIIENNLIAANKNALTVRGGTLSSPKINDLNVIGNSFKAGETTEEREDRFGISLEHVKYFNFRDNHVTGFKKSGITVNGGIRGGNIVGNRIYNNQENGITGNLVKWLHVSENQFQNNSSSDIEIINNINIADYSQNNSVSENTFLGGSAAKYKEGVNVRRNTLYSNKGATFAELKSGLNNAGSDTTLVSGQSADTTAYNCKLFADQNIHSDKMIIGRSGIGVGNAENKSVGSSMNRRVEVFDMSGSSLGFIQLFNG
ncbi:glycosyl hydrolase family 28-related protein [Providencia rettgeri]|uniref:glycosyl hydrolase family 28-related protein n=1 Tax=Providencia rettgeri TaxID=587 RepID=UPI00244AE34A|nr:glycosyl hydrolase family 28-related protein [Providencia rettgeri]MDH2379148.1 glycosyl hydrolase family 28-related protein [Providencia rettgeri]